ncbi:MAG: HDOD domain-containing protein [Planctomycetales bacterium]|nr:HDOD domain-containing protein [Planctomycetales bacterium]
MSPNPNPQQLDLFVQRAKSLYSLPAVAAKVLELTEHPRVDSAALKECIENDPAITAKILRVVNSAQYGHAHGIRDLGQALTVLGTKPLKMLVLGFSLPDRLFAGACQHTLLWYWRHTLTKAVAAREICREIWRRPGDEAFVAALLSDIGILVLVQELKQDYATFLNQVVAEQGDLLELETSALGFDHATLGARLLRHWGLPAILTEAIAAPKNLETLLLEPAEQTALARILHLAELVAQVVAERRYDVLPQFLAAGREYRNMKREQAQELIRQLDGQVTQLARILALDVNDGREYTQLVAEAHRRLAEETWSLAEQVSAYRDADVDACDRLLRETEALSAAANTACLQPASPKPATEVAADPAQPPVARPPRVGNHRTSTAIDVGLAGRLKALAARCRQDRCELTLLMVEIDQFEQSLLTLGTRGLDVLRNWMEATTESLEHADASALQVDDSRWAVLIPDCDRQSAVALAGELMLAREDAFTLCTSGSAAPPTLSIGAATLSAVPKNFAPEAILESAERCLYGARSAGGGTVKSIEIL